MGSDSKRHWRYRIQRMTDCVIRGIRGICVQTNIGDLCMRLSWGGMAIVITLYKEKGLNISKLCGYTFALTGRDHHRHANPGRRFACPGLGRYWAFSPRMWQSQAQPAHATKIRRNTRMRQKSGATRACDKNQAQHAHATKIRRNTRMRQKSGATRACGKSQEQHAHAAKSGATRACGKNQAQHAHATKIRRSTRMRQKSGAARAGDKSASTTASRLGSHGECEPRRERAIRGWP